MSFRVKVNMSFCGFTAPPLSFPAASNPNIFCEKDNIFDDLAPYIYYSKPDRGKHACMSEAAGPNGAASQSKGAITRGQSQVVQGIHRAAGFNGGQDSARN
jgi:hypothetical protein